MDEFAMGSSGEHSASGPAHNPWDTGKVPGGSSSGSVVSVAAGYAPFALGTDTGGSVRLPGSFCNITALRPTYGVLSRYGVTAMASSLDQVGPVAASARDLAAGFSVMAGPDPLDATSIDLPGRERLAALRPRDLKGLRIRTLPSSDRRKRWRVSDSTAIAQGAAAETGDAHGDTRHDEHPSYQRHHFESIDQQFDATNFAMWLFLLTEVMFFGGLFTAYLIYRNWYYPAFVAASHQLDVTWGTINTAVLITSGASVPERLVENVIAWFRRHGPCEVEECALTQEDLEFSLPKEIA